MEIQNNNNDDKMFIQGNPCQHFVTNDSHEPELSETIVIIMAVAMVMVSMMLFSNFILLSNTENVANTNLIKR